MGTHRELHLLAAVRYALTEPVHSKLVKLPWQYHWSSAGFHVGRRKTDPLVSPGKLSRLVGDWKQFLRDEDPESRERLLLCIRTGRPAGSPKFILKAEKATGVRLQKMKPGPKPKSKK